MQLASFRHPGAFTTQFSPLHHHIFGAALKICLGIGLYMVRSSWRLRGRDQIGCLRICWRSCGEKHIVNLTIVSASNVKYETSMLQGASRKLTCCCRRGPPPGLGMMRATRVWHTAAMRRCSAMLPLHRDQCMRRLFLPFTSTHAEWGPPLSAALVQPPTFHAKADLAQGWSAWSLGNGELSSPAWPYS